MPAGAGWPAPGASDAMAEVFMVSSLRWDAASTRLAVQEVVGDLVARHEAHALMRLEMLDQALQHQQHLGAAGDIGVDGDGEDRVVRSEERRVGKECRSRWSPYH